MKTAITESTPEPKPAVPEFPCLLRKGDSLVLFRKAGSVVIIASKYHQDIGDVGPAEMCIYTADGYTRVTEPLSVTFYP